MIRAFADQDPKAVTALVEDHLKETRRTLIQYFNGKLDPLSSDERHT